MEGGLPMLNCVLQQTLRSLCSCSDSSNPSKWVYAVFWKILPRNYPPPKWDYGGSFLDRSKGNKRNWILVWEDGFCDFYECERAGSGYIKGRFGADVFFKMSHEVYNYGEGLVGKVAAENTHKWVFKDIPPEKDPNLLSSWNASMDPQPKAWDFQFNSGIQTIAVISVKEGLIQLGSLEKIVEDLNLVISIQRKFSYLQSIPGVFTMQRPYLPIQQYSNMSSKLQTQIITDTKNGFFLEENRNVTGGKRCYGERFEEFPSKSINFGWNSPQINREGGGGGGGGGLPFCSIPPLLPTMSCSFEALLSKLPSVIPSLDTIGATDKALSNNNNYNYDSQTSNDNCGTELAQISRIKTESCNLDTSDEQKHQIPKANSSLEDYTDRLEDYTDRLEVGGGKEKEI